MNQTEIIHTAIYAGLFLALFATGELLFHKFKVVVEITRKYVHVGTGAICLSFPFYLGSHWSVLILTIAFFGILIVSIKMNLLQSINAVNRRTGGSFLFPVAIYGTFWAYSIFGLGDMDANNLDWQSAALEKDMLYGATVFYFLPILILTVSDPTAALVGKKFRLGKYKIFGGTKTVIGSAAFFVSAFLLSASFMIPVAQDVSGGLIIAACIAAVTTFLEAISQRGLDNLTIPFGTVMVMYIFNEQLII